MASALRRSERALIVARMVGGPVHVKGFWGEARADAICPYIGCSPSRLLAFLLIVCIGA
jgi:hypothetical protein